MDKAFDDVSNSGYASCSDCGSALVADTVKLFVDNFKKSVKAEKAHAEHTAESMQNCADDFNQVETAQVQQIRQLMEMVS